MSYHKLLERQLRRFFGSLEQVPSGLEPFLSAVDEAYRAADEDRLSIERSLELMSRELTERNDQLRGELAGRQLIEEALLQEKAEQAALFRKLEETHCQLLQSEKMASIGQLAAGLAHEINNPIGFVTSNVGSLRTYVLDLLKVIDAFEAEKGGLGESARRRIDTLEEQVELALIREDSMPVLDECAEGLRRVRQIIRDLTEFSRMDEARWHRADLHRGLESTLNIVHNEVRHVADVIKEYGELPEVECLPSQLNQVFLNLLVNAAQAIKGKRGTITVRTGRRDGDHVFVEISDNGEGIAPEHLNRIFDPFFTTKPVGQGTGLGLALSYGIVARHHGGIEVDSTPGVGTRFRVVLPIRQSAETASAPA
ncbi:ATP-binding protein [Hyalangium versicolor]|uniref:ATP-binding protein n=1 Tax=Hyalangium versicolor TaxID=2861190 RepID=UPI001CCB5FB3|nr:ATP-binding protein [Hyalangium versicolor]